MSENERRYRMIAPRIHLNGTARIDLQNALREAYAALTAALEKLRETLPHARDYYVIGPDAYTQARKEYEAREARIRTSRAEILDMFQAIDRNEITF